MNKTPEQRQNLKNFIEHLSRSIRPLICGDLVDDTHEGFEATQGCCLLAELNIMYGYAPGDDEVAYGFKDGCGVDSLSEVKLGLHPQDIYIFSDRCSQKGVKMVRELAPLVAKEFLGEE